MAGEARRELKQTKLRNIPLICEMLFTVTLVCWLCGCSVYSACIESAISSTHSCAGMRVTAASGRRAFIPAVSTRPLALVPIVPLMPHSRRDLGLFDEREEYQPETLNRFEHWWATPVQFVLLLFGFANAGVPFAQIGAGTYYVLAALLLGRPIGILMFSGIARLAGCHLPPGLRSSDLLVVGLVAAIGFIVSLSLLRPRSRGGRVGRDEEGSASELVAAPVAVAVSRLLCVRAN